MKMKKMGTIIENINTILTTKNELGNIMIENDVTVPQLFEDYPDALRSILETDRYVTYAYLESKNYATQAYVVDYVTSYSVSPLTEEELDELFPLNSQIDVQI